VKLFVALATVAVGGVASAQLTQPVAFGHAVIVEASSPGLVPSMKFNYINLYGPDLEYVRTLASAPLLRSFGAIAFSSSGDIFLVEPCDPLCVQIKRYQQSGSVTDFGAPYNDSIHAMQFVASGELIVAFSVVFARFDANGGLIQTTALPERTLFGFDVDRDQCTVIFSSVHVLVATNICTAGHDVRLPGDFSGVRFLPNGNILASSRGVVYELDRRGAIVRRFITSYIDSGEVAVDPDEKSFWATSGNRLFRFDLTTGNVIAGPVWLRTAAYGARSMAIRGEWRAAMHPVSRRRSVTR